MRNFQGSSVVEEQTHAPAQMIAAPLQPGKCLSRHQTLKLKPLIGKQSREAFVHDGISGFAHQATSLSHTVLEQRP